MLSNVWDGDWRVSQPFGCTDLTVEPAWRGCLPLGFAHYHCGIDIAMPRGTRLYAARAGEVSQVGYGYLCIDVGLQHDWMVHIDRAIVRVGQQVKQGQAVAYSGDKAPAGGTILGAHLHFEIQTGRLNYPGTALDPLPVLTAHFGADSGSLGDPDLTAREHELLIALVSQFLNISETATPPAVKLELDAILAAVKAIQVPTTPAPTVDLSPVLAAIAELRIEVEDIKATTDALKAI